MLRAKTARSQARPLSLKGWEVQFVLNAVKGSDIGPTLKTGDLNVEVKTPFLLHNRRTGRD